ncbi:RNA-directed DNA polymerase from mobile element jockey [Trichonephila clavata]|uniref:RNA-directed DNA polymerase from mobile element jockey n=1 Tax=Trichonephila clavata TaxID=2740835 RepID=A0A8X6GC01_TRICU|nr:RNA-directed DNA polymerase from mobile element jockey [Trichonephila clavata]
MLNKLRKNSSPPEKPNSTPPKPTSIAPNLSPPLLAPPQAYSKALTDSLPKNNPPLAKPPQTHLNNTPLRLISWNSNSILPKKEEFLHFIEINNPDIIALQETFLKPGHTFNVANYSIYRNDRTSGAGGGTAILIKNSIRHHPIDIVTHNSEQTAISIEGTTHHLTICSFYKPPSASTPATINDLLKIFRNRPRCFILGDFNLKHRSWNPDGNGRGGAQLFNFTRNCGFCISAPTEPTRIPHHHNARPSIIDFAISSGLSNITAKSMFDLSSDHNPVFFTFTLTLTSATP